jgi:hypothetical protein
MVYQEKFPVGTIVCVKSREFLEDFQRTWNLHHPIESRQIGFAGSKDVVRSVGFYHGGDVLYQLQDAPGTWHERCLELEQKER